MRIDDPGKGSVGQAIYWFMVRFGDSVAAILLI